MLIRTIPLLLLLAPGIADAQTRPTVHGLVVNEAGEPVPGVTYWLSGFRAPDGGLVHYTGIEQKRLTGEAGEFACEFGGQGRIETSVDITFEHEDFAQNRLTGAEDSASPYRVTLASRESAGGLATHASTIRGRVINAERELIIFAKVWVSGFRDGDGELVSSTGIREPLSTGADGFFAFPETKGLDLTIQREGYAPTFLTGANAAESPYTVTLDPGIPLAGKVVLAKSDLPLQLWKRSVWLDVYNPEAGDTSTFLKTVADSDGAFEFRIPTDYGKCAYWIIYAGTRTRLDLPAKGPLPEIRLRADVSVSVEGASAP